MKLIIQFLKRIFEENYIMKQEPGENLKLPEKRLPDREPMN